MPDDVVASIHTEDYEEPHQLGDPSVFAKRVRLGTDKGWPVWHPQPEKPRRAARRAQP